MKVQYSHQSSTYKSDKCKLIIGIK